MIEAEPANFSPIDGAEARIELVDWYGKPAIRKARMPKPYRIELLDRTIRSRRTKEEVEILHACKLAGVDCPQVHFADPISSEIIMEYIQGTVLKDFRGDTENVLRQVGSKTARLHLNRIIHGDLTTKNMIISGERVAFIDFGLSFFSDRIEDRAEDLHLLKQALKSSESTRKANSQFEEAMNGYLDIAGKKDTAAVKKQIAKIELRGRYAQVD
jgi:TP53 regulating kinase-like protein